MNNVDDKIKQTCTTCYQIACKKCDWVASNEEVVLIQKEILTECPKCGWSPGDEIKDLRHMI